MRMYLGLCVYVYTYTITLAMITMLLRGEGPKGDLRSTREDRGVGGATWLATLVDNLLTAPVGLRELPGPQHMCNILALDFL